MRVIQMTGPFTTGQSFSVESMMDREYVHIGIQVPNRWPIRAIPMTKDKSIREPVVKINDDYYTINDNGILEFDGLVMLGCTIKFLQNLPAETIVDIVYKDSEI